MSAPVAEARGAVGVARSSPYQGLAPYREADADWFFGREEWCEVIADNLRAYRITVLYGWSGSARARSSAPASSDGCATRRPGASPRASGRDSRSSASPPGASTSRSRHWRRAWPPPRAAPGPEGALADVLEAWQERTGEPLLLVLDQLEELFAYHDRPG
jgi:hypothetical protein